MKLLFSIALLIVSTNAVAKDYSQCKLTEEYARVIMESRQIGIPAKDFLRDLDREELSVRKLVMALTVEAYSFPIIHSESYKQEVIDEFVNSALITCMRGH